MKKNNGFSLVELIVVVLIMAIIAVALAPQVMKWVDNSRISTDISNYDEMVANLQVAITDKDAYAEAMTNTVLVEIDLTGTKIGGKKSDDTSLDAIGKAMNSVAPGWDKIAKKCPANNAQNPAAYQITVKEGGVFKTKAPVANADLS